MCRLDQVATKTKTITIDIEAYLLLKRVQRPNESLSQTIQRVVHHPIDIRAWANDIAANPLSDEAVDAVEKQVAGRRFAHRR